MNQERECIIITGSSGLLGDALSHHFSTDYQVIGLDQEAPPNQSSETKTIFCDLTSDESLQKTMFMVRTLYGLNIKAVFHLAAYYSFSGKSSHLYKDLTVDGTKRLLRELESFNVGQFIFSSSMLVYKPGSKHQKLAEEAEVKPTWDYPRSKVDTEALIEAKRGKIPASILRIAGVYTDKCQSIPLAHQIQRIYEHQLEGHLYSGDVDAKQSFVHLDDVVAAFAACLQKGPTVSDFEVYNIGEGEAMSYDDLQRTIARELFDEPWPTFDVPKPLAKAGAWVEEFLPLPEEHFIKPWMIDRASDNYELDIDKADRLLGWQPQHSLRDTLPAMIEGLKHDPEKWYAVNKLHFSRGRQQKQMEHEEANEPAAVADFHPTPTEPLLLPPAPSHTDK